MRYRLGLDLGIASVGWSIIHLDDTGQPDRIVDLGVRVFNAAENPKDGESLALPRRIARGVRRRLRRRNYRLKRIQNLFVEYGLLSRKKIQQIFEQKHLESVWNIRLKALDFPITNEELYRAVYHICKRRGFKSNRKAERTGEEGALLKGISQNELYLKENGYRTIGEMFAKDERFAHRKRNTTNDYSMAVSRQLLEQELNMILNRQREFGNLKITDEFIARCLEIFNSQRPFASKDMIEKLVGSCTFEVNEKRAPKATYTYEYSMLLQKVNSLRIKKDGKYYSLNDEERKKIIDLAFKKRKVTYKDIRKKLEISDDVRFKSLTYGDSPEKTEVAVFVQLKAYQDLKSLFKKHDELEMFNLLSTEHLDAIGIALTLYKTDEDIIEYLQNCGVNENVINLVLELSFSGFGNLSLKALKRINVHLEKGYTYDKACELAGYDFKGRKSGKKEKLLPKIPNEDITNPVVLRTLTQCRKVINAIIRRYGSPETIHIELARDMNHSYEERKKMTREMEQNRKINESAIRELQTKYNQLQPSGHDIVKMKLWTQQQGFCVYSGEYIDPIKLFEPGYVEVDHIIPYSRSLDDSYNNKVLVLSIENQQKGNKIPYEYFGSDEERWHEFEERVKASNFSRKKKANLLRKSFNEDDEREFLNKNLNDTRYAARFLKNFIEDNLKFSNTGNYKQRVFTVNGPVTSFLRKRWGLTKLREDNDRHHALDATVVALASPSMIKKVTAYYKYNEIRYYKTKRFDNHLRDPFTGEIFEIDDYTNPKVLERFPLPWANFREELEIRLYSENPAHDIEKLQLKNYQGVDLNNIRPLFVSRMPIRKFTGQVHKETIFSGKLFNEGYIIKRVALEDIKFDNNGDFPMYGKESDPYTYNAIKNRYLEYNKDVKKAFKEPLYKPKKNGEPGPVIKKIKILQKSHAGVILEKINGVAENGQMVRIDIFTKDNKFYIVPIYMADLVKRELPNKIIKANVPRKDWPTIDDTYEFLFSLQQNDLVKLTRKDGVIFGYYRRCPGNQTSIFIDFHDGSNKNDPNNKYGITNAISIEKYVVDPLGYYHKVKKEKRRGLA